MYEDTSNYFLNYCNCCDSVNSSEVRALYFVAKAGNLEKRSVIKSSGIARFYGRGAIAYTHQSITTQRKSLCMLYNMSIYNRVDLIFGYCQLSGFIKNKTFRKLNVFPSSDREERWRSYCLGPAGNSQPSSLILLLYFLRKL
jgi:hypothetical protein